MKTPVSGPRIQPRPSETPKPALPRNEVKPAPQPKAARADSVGVSKFDSGKGRAGNVALSSPVTAPAAGGIAPGSYPTAADVKAIAAMKDPVARNYAITQGYHDLSDAMGKLVGDDNANWATFGTWASKQAGVSIRGEDMPKVFNDVLKGAGGVMGPLGKVDDFLRKLGLPALPLGTLARPARRRSPGSARKSPAATSSSSTRLARSSPASSTPSRATRSPTRRSCRRTWTASPRTSRCCARPSATMRRR
ncbi:hypothetical protein [Pyxidicoccus sp. MSG2]|uniref:hypothetical protein n=1 Tax=Pyxidicoccus sp. MSG2 TaxID=2996790 RepID=UPI003B641EFE